MECSNPNSMYTKECNSKLEEIENQNRVELANDPNLNEDLYPTLDDPNFSLKINLKA